VAPTFRIARNPDEDSTLPYLLSVPVGPTPLVLKAKDTWPRTAKTTRKTRPGLRLPTRRSASGVLEIVVDTRERYAWRFEHQQVTLSKRALAAGDYAVEVDGEVVGVVERKKLPELAGNVVDGSLLVRLAELATARRAAIVVEDRWADVFRLRHVAPSMVAEMLAAAQVRYPNVPIVFCETRPLAQEWAYRFLGAAAAYAAEEAVDVEQGAWTARRSR
jgi:hypothetical protein